MIGLKPGLISIKIQELKLVAIDIGVGVHTRGVPLTKTGDLMTSKMDYDLLVFG